MLWEYLWSSYFTSSNEGQEKSICVGVKGTGEETCSFCNINFKIVTNNFNEKMSYYTNKWKI